MLCCCASLLLNAALFAPPVSLPRRPLCRDGSPGRKDYFFNDGLGHDYYSNICGIAAAKCLPPNWVATCVRPC
jgi:hypothetical protein